MPLDALRSLSQAVPEEESQPGDQQEERQADAGPAPAADGDREDEAAPPSPSPPVRLSPEVTVPGSGLDPGSGAKHGASQAQAGAHSSGTRVLDNAEPPGFKGTLLAGRAARSGRTM